MTFQGVDAGQIADDGRFMDIANITLVRNGAQVATLRPRHDIYPSTEGQQGMTMIIPGSYSTLENDFYVLFVAGQADGSATFKVYINPLINLIWWGGLILIVGTLISAWPAENAPASVRERRRARPTAAGVAAG